MKAFPILATVALLTSSSAIGFAQSGSTAATQPDNTKVNQRDRNEGEPTADSQKSTKGDQDLTQKVRQSIVGDKSLSTYAHNIKVISINGTVTLKGPVRSEEERKALVAKAAELAGTDKVNDQLSVKP